MGGIAMCDDEPTAQKLLESELKTHPEDSIVNKVYVPLIKAIGEVKRGNGAAALTALEVSRPFAYGTGQGNPAHYVFYVRGLAYLQMKDGEKAATEVRKIVGRPGVATMNELHPMAQLQLARALAMQGDSSGAKKAYQDFLSAWRDADPDVPVLVEAKAEYGKMK
jgi:eukaryotic-like serine/threonine-protein kinase